MESSQTPVRIVRLAAESDAADLVAIDVATVADGRGVVQTLDELGGVADEAAAVVSMHRQRDAKRPAALWVAEISRQVVAYASMRPVGPSLCAHVAIVSMATHPAAQRCGHGRAVLTALVADADARGVVRLELYVRDDNTRAHALYESLGFVHEATRRRFVRLPDGRFVDDRIYARLRG